jgi:hypothetical protein
LKRSEGKRSIEDTRRVAEYRVARLGTTSGRGGKLSPATVNRECALLRSILRLALAWDEVSKLPVFKMAKEERRERFCPSRRSPAAGRMPAVEEHAPAIAGADDAAHRAAQGELLWLRWEQIDFTRVVIALGRPSCAVDRS